MKINISRKTKKLITYAFLLLIGVRVVIEGMYIKLERDNWIRVDANSCLRINTPCDVVSSNELDCSWAKFRIEKDAKRPIENEYQSAFSAGDMDVFANIKKDDLRSHYIGENVNIKIVGELKSETMKAPPSVVQCPEGYRSNFLRKLK